MSHRPLQIAPLHDLTQANGEDIYEHPEWFGYSETDYFRESVRVFRSVRNEPDALVTIYRSAPELETIKHGDWVALAESYAPDARNAPGLVRPGLAGVLGAGSGAYGLVGWFRRE